MKKAILISVFCAVLLSSCGSKIEPVNKVAIPTNNSSTAYAVTAKTTSAEEKETSETAVTTAKTEQSSQRVSTTSAVASTSANTTTAVSTTANSDTSRKHTAESTTKAQAQSQKQTSSAKVESKPAPTKNSTVVTTTKKQTATTSASTTASVTTTKAQPAVTWNDTMKAWRKLCEGRSLNGSEWELVRQDIISYAFDKFNGKTTVDLDCGIDKYTRTFPYPLNLSVDNSLADISHARMDSYCEAECSILINMASDESEIYEIVEETRADCMTVVDRGINNWYVFCERYGELEYASDIPFNLYLDDTSIWFLTE